MTLKSGMNFFSSLHQFGNVDVGAATRNGPHKFLFSAKCANNAML